MKPVEPIDQDDDILPSYDLNSLRVRRLGEGRRSFALLTVRLEPDVAKMFPSADAVNEALRLLMRMLHQNQDLMATIQPKSSQEQTGDD